jgi:hypothetical protein
MRTAATIALLTAGAILTFAVSARVPGVDLRLAGVFIIAAGIAALLVSPSPAADWLRRRLGHPGAAGPAPAPHAADEPGDEAYPAYLLQDPAVLAAEVLNGIRSDNWPDPGHPAPPPQAPRTSGRAAGPRPLHSVDSPPSSGAGPHHGARPGHEAGFGQQDQFG